MAMAAEHTERVEICSSVTIAFPRTPMILAQSAWDMQQLSGGRINIGLGSQVKGHNVRRFGGTWTPPAKRMEDYIGMMRGRLALLADRRAPWVHQRQLHVHADDADVRPRPDRLPRTPRSRWPTSAR